MSAKTVEKFSYLMRLGLAGWRDSAELVGDRARTAAPSWGFRDDWGVLAVRRI